MKNCTSPFLIMVMALMTAGALIPSCKSSVSGQAVKSPVSGPGENGDGGLSDGRAAPGPRTICWTDSREEYDHGDSIMIFRPCDYKDFPPSRFRFRMVLNADSSARYLYLSPTDAHHMRAGNWHYAPASGLLEIRDEEGQIVRSFRVETLEDDRLGLKRRRH